MELWIRSQDRESLVEIKKLFYFNNCPEMPSMGKHYIGNKEWIGEKDYVLLGEYKTKERALEVLNEIQEAKLGNFHYKCPSNVKVSIKEDTIVYEMPKE